MLCVGARLTSANQGLLVVGVILLSVAVVLGVIITLMVFKKGMYHYWLRIFLVINVFSSRTMAISESLCDRISCNICISRVVGCSGISCWIAKK